MKGVHKWSCMKRAASKLELCQIPEGFDCPLLIAHVSLPTSHCPLLIAHFSLPTSHCPLLIAHFSLPTSHCPLLISHAFFLFRHIYIYMFPFHKQPSHIVSFSSHLLFLGTRVLVFFRAISVYVVASSAVPALHLLTSTSTY